jgi:glycosyltransferase involved in cell wall biosynthesis
VTSVAVGVDQLWYEVPGGVGTYIRNLIPAMLARDPSLDLTLFHARFERPDPDEPWMTGMRVETLSSSIRTLYPSWALAGRPALPGAIASSDVAHATNGVAIPPAGRGRRLVVTIHDLAFVRYPNAFPRRWRFLYRLGLRAAARRADAILVPSKSTARDVLETTGVDEARVHVTPLATSPPREPAADAAETLRRLDVPEPYVLYVGTIEPRKNLDTLLRAYRRAAGRGIPHALVLVGPPGWRMAEFDREWDAGGPGRIEHTGVVTADDLEVLYRHASAFVYPSLYEGFGLPVLEAMARGVPTVTSNSSSLPEVAGDAAILVDPHSVDELADAITRIVTDTDLAARLSVEGTARAASFSWDETARLTLAAYGSAQRE